MQDKENVFVALSLRFSVSITDANAEKEKRTNGEKLQMEWRRMKCATQGEQAAGSEHTEQLANTTRSS